MIAAAAFDIRRGVVMTGEAVSFRTVSDRNASRRGCSPVVFVDGAVDADVENEVDEEEGSDVVFDAISGARSCSISRCEVRSGKARETMESYECCIWPMRRRLP